MREWSGFLLVDCCGCMVISGSACVEICWRWTQLFALHFMTNTLFLDLPSPTSTSFLKSYGQSNLGQATIPDPTDRILVGPLPPHLSHSLDLDSVGAQMIISLGRFLV